MFLAGQWCKQAAKWESIGTSPTVLSWIQEGVRLPFLVEPEPFELPNKPLSPAQSAFIDTELASLVSSGAIRICSFKPVCVSPIWCVPKKKSFRLVIDLRRLNLSCPCPAFQYEGISSVLDSVKAKDQLATIDLKNGYHHLSVHKDFHRYLGFKWRNKYYTWQVIPFGLAVSPYYFCKSIRQVIKYLRTQGIRISAYVDDFILAATPEAVVRQRDFVLQVLADLGFTINTEKSSLTPSCSQVHIGYRISTDNPDNQVWISIPKERIRQLRHDINRLLNKGQGTARALARIAGQCVSMALAIIPAKLLIRNLYRLLQSRSSWQDILVLDPGTKSDLLWWTSALKYWNGAAAPRRSIDLQVTSDASAVAWGGHCNNQEAQGFWTPDVTRQSSNYRELMAILLCLLTFLDFLRCKSVQFLSDNVTAVAYVNFQGGPSPELTRIAQTIWTIALENQMTICAKHLAGLHNGRADGLSRLSPQYEWQLNPHLWMYLDTLWGPHSVDRFASLITTQLPRYNSRYQDPYSEAVDALAQDNWQQENNYVNCPFRLLPRVLDVIVQQQALATVIAPWWPSQPWFHRLKALTIAPPLRIPNTRQTFRSVLGRTPEPRKNRCWKLYAWRVYGQLGS